MVQISDNDRRRVRMIGLDLDGTLLTSDKELTEESARMLTELSSRGIHIVPVVSSNGSRETELFGRALAICTNGEYVFLTDDSGIGGSHLEPIIGDYTVEPLHDIIVRIIQEYKQSCLVHTFWYLNSWNLEHIV